MNLVRVNYLQDIHHLWVIEKIQFMISKAKEQSPGIDDLAKYSAKQRLPEQSVLKPCFHEAATPPPQYTVPRVKLSVLIWAAPDKP
jgi:hypothetical protein